MSEFSDRIKLLIMMLATITRFAIVTCVPRQFVSSIGSRAYSHSQNFGKLEISQEKCKEQNLKSQEYEKESYVENNSHQRKQLASLVLEAFDSKFRSSDSEISALYPYIREIATPPTPEVFLQMEQMIIKQNNSRYLKTGGYLTQYQYVVPSINGTEDDKCSLTRYPVCARFNEKEINTFLVELFEAIQQETGKGDIPKIYLSRYDLFHGHYFLDYDSNGIGILFHAKEYPKYDQTCFPYNLGYCQKGSWLEFSSKVMNHRNILWYKGQLGVLNVSPEGALDNLVWNLLRPVDTVLESDFGWSPVDINYFEELQFTDSVNKLFIC